MNRPSKRFKPSTWSEWVVPALLVLIAVGLLATFAIIALSLMGLTPSL